MAQRHANAGTLTYRGDARGTVGKILGPNALGEWLIAVNEAYDSLVGVTKVGFDYARKEDLQEAVADAS